MPRPVRSLVAWLLSRSTSARAWSGKTASVLRQTTNWFTGRGGLFILRVNQLAKDFGPCMYRCRMKACCWGDAQEDVDDTVESELRRDTNAYPNADLYQVSICMNSMQPFL